MDPILEDSVEQREETVTKDFVLTQEELDMARANIENNIGRDCKLVTINETELMDCEDGQRAFVVGEYKDGNNTDRTWICLAKRTERSLSIYSSDSVSNFLRIKCVKEKFELPMLLDVLQHGLAIEDIKARKHYVLMPDLTILDRSEYIDIFENN
jgi:hypothetical protein